MVHQLNTHSCVKDRGLLYIEILMEQHVLSMYLKETFYSQVLCNHVQK